VCCNKDVSLNKESFLRLLCRQIATSLIPPRATTIRVILVCYLSLVLKKILKKNNHRAIRQELVEMGEHCGGDMCFERFFWQMTLNQYLNYYGLRVRTYKARL